MSEIKEYYKQQAEKALDSFQDLKDLKISVGEGLTMNHAKEVLAKAKQLFSEGKTFKDIYGEKTPSGKPGELGPLLVMAVQRFVEGQKDGGFDTGMDGIYGTKTQEGVEYFQKQRNIDHSNQDPLDPDGRAGKETIDAMLMGEGTPNDDQKSSGGQDGNNPSASQTPNQAATDPLVPIPPPSGKQDSLPVTPDHTPEALQNAEGATDLPLTISGIEGLYTGPLEDGLPHGKGTRITKEEFAPGSHDRYEGDFANGHIFGMGTFTDANRGRKIYGSRTNDNFFVNSSQSIPINKIKEYDTLNRFSDSTPDLSIDDTEREKMDHDERRGPIEEKLTVISKAFGIPDIRLRNDGEYDYGDIKIHLYEISKAISSLPEETKEKMNTHTLNLIVGHQGLFSGNWTEKAILDEDGIEESTAGTKRVIFDYNESAEDIKNDIVKHVDQWLAESPSPQQ